ncbi:MAG: hypothetical protein MI810_06670 [Flavobacteriales bacterium]|jgi:hypothetical protein|nr:hypothetical protein [Flavobacteriales bacterium]
MALGFGPGSNMQKAVKAQRKQMQKRSLKESSEITAGGLGSDPALKFKNESSPEELATFKAKLQAEKRRNQFLTYGGMIGIIILALILSFCF